MLIYSENIKEFHLSYEFFILTNVKKLTMK